MATTGADCETGEPKLDSETGEDRECTVMGFPALVRSREARTLQVTVSTDAETGENEWNTSSGYEEFSPPEHHHSPFHIPSSYLQNHAGAPDLRCFAHIMCLLPVLILFPALAVSICLVTEISIHWWVHKWEITRKPGDKVPMICIHRSPIQQLLSSCCSHCQSMRVFANKGTKLRSQKHKLSRTKLKNDPFFAIHRQVASS